MWRCFDHPVYHSKSRVLTKVTHYMAKESVDDWDRFEILAAANFTEHMKALAAKMKKVFSIHVRVHGDLFVSMLKRLVQTGA